MSSATHDMLRQQAQQVWHYEIGLGQVIFENRA
jgi:hypothetical protein